MNDKSTARTPPQLKDEFLYRSRTDRLMRLIKCDGPPVVIVQECWSVILAYGFWPWLKFTVRLRVVQHLKVTLWFFWHRTIMRRSHDQIDELIEKSI